MDDNDITALVGWPTEPEMARYRKVAAAAESAERERMEIGCIEMRQELGRIRHALGVMDPITQEMVDCWRANYGLDARSPSDAARYWIDTCAGMAPAGAVAALGLLLQDRERWLKAAAAALEVMDDLPEWSSAAHACQLLRECVGPNVLGQL